MWPSIIKNKPTSINFTFYHLFRCILIKFMLFYRILAKKNAQLEQRLQKLFTTESESNCANQDLVDFSPAKYLLEGYNPSAMVDEEKETQTDNFTERNLSLTNPSIYIQKQNDSLLENKNGNLYHQQDNHLKNGNENDVDSLSSFTSESERSIASSDYELNRFNLLESEIEPLSKINRKNNHNNNNSLQLLIPFESTFSSNTTSARSSGTRTSRESYQSSANNGVCERFLKQRQDFLKNLPIEMSSLIEKALHELDSQDLDFKPSPGSTSEVSINIKALFIFMLIFSNFP